MNLHAVCLGDSWNRLVVNQNSISLSYFSISRLLSFQYHIIQVCFRTFTVFDMCREPVRFCNNPNLSLTPRGSISFRPSAIY